MSECRQCLQGRQRGPRRSPGTESGLGSDLESWADGVVGSPQRLRSSIEHGHGRHLGRATSQRAVGKCAGLANAVIFEEPLPAGNLSFPSY